ncbi:hypothetical protein AN403_5256 [Pseudomonas fluorescens]|uniref:Uncharacterized protein n=1 Tax=Pseudomonas fluorescens TaxID=294 RepID=A0A0P8ZUM0_PSEFL|nr:hypothetical protein [Pseudomonas fluorescens]KPU61075.1 hypothetical protein AN403_5256 [Pseudomonas fluorescens]
MVLTPVVQAILRSSAPTLLAALALPPPFNVIAAAVVSGALSVDLPAPAAPAAPPAAAPAPPPPVAPAQPVSVAGRILTPEQIVNYLESNTEDPNLLLKLRSAEADLKKYEIDAGIRFAELEFDDRARAGDFQRDTGLARNVFTAGMGLVAFSLLGLIAVIYGSFYVASHPQSLVGIDLNLATAAFGIVGTAVGFVNGISANIVGFYWGSSQGSKDKGDQIAQTVHNFGDQLNKRSAAKPPAETSSSQDGSVG